MIYYWMLYLFGFIVFLNHPEHCPETIGLGVLPGPGVGFPAIKLIHKLAGA